MISLSKLLAGFVKEPIPNDLTVTGLALDHRLIQPGDVFLAYPGTHHDGRFFIKEAIQKGAIAVLAEAPGDITSSTPVFYIEHLKKNVSEMAARFYHYPAEKLHIIGVTGTNGKTSCAHFMAAALQQLGHPCGVIGTLGNGLYGDITPSPLTTPDAISLQKLFLEFSEKKAAYVSMEVSSHSLEQDRVAQVPFQVGIFTNLTRDHLDYHGTMHAYAAAKRKLFENPLLQNAVINADDAFGQTLIQAFSKQKNVVAYSLRSPYANLPSVFVKKSHYDAAGIHAEITSPWGEGILNSALIGEFNLSNLLAALTTLCLLDFPFERVCAILSQLKAISGRMQTAGHPKTPLVVVDYSHTPDALEQALKALKRHCLGRLYCLFGCGGDRDRGKRPMMAAIAEKWADKVMVTDDNPRTEDPKQIVADILLGFADKSRIVVEHDRLKAIQAIIQEAKVGDIILVAGKGAERYQQMGELKIPFDDYEEVNKALLLH